MNHETRHNSRSTTLKTAKLSSPNPSLQPIPPSPSASTISSTALEPESPLNKFSKNISTTTSPPLIQKWAMVSILLQPRATHGPIHRIKMMMLSGNISIPCIPEWTLILNLKERTWLLKLRRTLSQWHYPPISDKNTLFAFAPISIKRQMLSL